MFEVIEADTPDLLKASFAIRHEVFVLEQNVPENVDRDEMDLPGSSARHFLLLKNTSPIGTARVLYPYGGDLAKAKVQRVAILEKERGCGAGTRLMQGVHAAYPRVTTFVLGAQITAMGLYQKLGYVAEGEDYVDAGIPHRDMRMQRRLGSSVSP